MLHLYTSSRGKRSWRYHPDDDPADELLPPGHVCAIDADNEADAARLGALWLSGASALEVAEAANDADAAAGLQLSARWGGAREGAGRKTLADEPTRHVNITLPASLDAKAVALGGGNRSEGVRKALAAVQLRTYRGAGVCIDLYREGATIAYRMVGQGIAEQVDTTKMNEQDLLEVLLAPMGLQVRAGEIVESGEAN